MSDRSDRKQLDLLGKTVVELLRLRKAGTGISLFPPRQTRPSKTNTDGWCITLGKFHPGRCEIQVWLDRYPGYSGRSIWVGFYSARHNQIDQLARRCTKSIGVHRVLTEKDVDLALVSKQRLKKPLHRSELMQPMLEHYPSAREHFYGIFMEPNLLVSTDSRLHVAERIVIFFESVARVYSKRQASDPNGDSYWAVENRKVVTKHLRRERDTYLALQRKERDDYRCQVCKMKFDEVYGSLGSYFAEVHHVVPLGKLESVRSSTVDDLITVCANCHRMLHRLEGRVGDLGVLRKIVSTYRHMKKR